MSVCTAKNPLYRDRKYEMICLGHAMESSVVIGQKPSYFFLIKHHFERKFPFLHFQIPCISVYKAISTNSI